MVVAILQILRSPGNSQSQFLPMAQQSRPELTIRDLLRKLINFFLGKAQSRLEALEEERLEGQGVSVVRYRRKTIRAYRTWRLIYKDLGYDIILGWDTLCYIPDVPRVRKQDRLSTHFVHIYRQGIHTRFNPVRGVNEPDVETLFESEVCLEKPYMADLILQWSNKTRDREKPVLTADDLADRMIDEIAKYALRHPPAQISPLVIPWRTVIEQTVRLMLYADKHSVFPEFSY
jgi:hypothetical protein